MKVIEETPEKLVLKIESSPRFINTLRRYVIGRVPVFAIDKLKIYENRTAYFDEYVAHRFGQIPLTTPAKDIAEEDVGFFIDVVGPNVVYAKDLIASNKEVVPAFGDIPLVKLAEGQSLRVEAYVKKGIGRDHAKFQAGIASYKLEDDGSYTFFVESIGQMPAREVLTRALDKIVEDLEALGKSLKNF